MTFLLESDPHGAALRHTIKEWDQQIENFIKEQNEYYEAKGKRRQSVLAVKYADDNKGVEFWTTDLVVNMYSTTEHNWGKGVDEDKIETDYQYRHPKPSFIITM